MEPFIGEIRLAGFGFAPTGWALCNGQTLSINSNQALYSLLGTTYGGNGITNFLLPDLRGRLPVHRSTDIVIGQSAGEATHVLRVAEMPSHTHVPRAAASATVASPAGAAVAPGPVPTFSTTPDSTMAAASIAQVGGNAAHENMSPYLTLNFIIALTGIFPSRG
jgi:microcystin-dependent protein